jgi:hypothetical protein
MMPPSGAQELAVLRSVTYASLFDYPLTLPQLRESLIGEAADEHMIADWLATSPLLQATIEQQDGLYFPRGRRDLLATRQRREALSRELLDRDRRILRFLTRLPFVRMVALSGSLAHLNAEGGSDLDLFVITSPGRVWCVTLFVLIVARLRGWRRRLCLNYVVSERSLAIEPADLFSANQIIHLRPVTGEFVYRRFLAANTFVAGHYPNFSPRRVETGGVSAFPSRAKTLLEFVLSIGLAPLADRASRVVYGWHLRRRSRTWKSRDQVRLERECLKLHTSSHRADTMTRYAAALERALAFTAVERLAKIG